MYRIVLSRQRPPHWQHVFWSWGFFFLKQGICTDCGSRSFFESKNKNKNDNLLTGQIKINWLPIKKTILLPPNLKIQVFLYLSIIGRFLALPLGLRCRYTCNAPYRSRFRFPPAPHFVWPPLGINRSLRATARHTGAHAPSSYIPCPLSFGLCCRCTCNAPYRSRFRLPPAPHYVWPPFGINRSLRARFGHFVVIYNCCHNFTFFLIHGLDCNIFSWTLPVFYLV